MDRELNSRPRSNRKSNRTIVVEVDPEAIRRAREEAGLTQAQLGKPILTRQAVHSIEAGKVRPSERSLGHIAQRLGLPVEALLREGGPPPESRVVQLRQLCEARRYADAVGRAETLLRSRSAPPELVAAAHHYAGVALHHQRDFAPALLHLQEARARAQALRDTRLVAESLDWEAAVRHEMNEFPRALALARDALARYRRLRPRDPRVEARMLERVATALGRLGRHQEAESTYHESLQAQGVVASIAGAGRVFHGLAGISRQKGDLDRAVDLMRKANRFYELERDLSPDGADVPLVKAQNDLAELLLDVGRVIDLDEADRLLASAQQGLSVSGAGVATLRPYILHTISRLRQMQGRLVEAIDYAHRTIALSEELGSLPIPLAEGLQQLAELAEARGEPELADQSYGRAIAVLTEAGLAEAAREARRAHRRLRRERRRPSGAA